MNSIKPSVFFISFFALFQVYDQSVSNYFRIWKNVTIQNNNKTNQFLLETILFDTNISNINRLSCLVKCMKNFSCDFVVYDIDQNSCRLYTMICSFSFTADSSVVYDKYLKKLWDCSASNTTSTTTSLTTSFITSTVTSPTTKTTTTTTKTTTTTTTTVASTNTGCQNNSPNYHYNSTYNLCFYYNSASSYYSWSDSYQFCRNLNGLLAILDTNEKLKFALSIQNYQKIWVGSNSSISNAFYWLDGSTVNPSFLYTGSTESDCNFTSTEKCLYLNQAGYLDDCPCSAYRSIMCQF